MTHGQPHLKVVKSADSKSPKKREKRARPLQPRLYIEPFKSECWSGWGSHSHFEMIRAAPRLEICFEAFERDKDQKIVGKIDARFYLGKGRFYLEIPDHVRLRIVRRDGDICVKIDGARIDEILRSERRLERQLRRHSWLRSPYMSPDYAPPSRLRPVN